LPLIWLTACNLDPLPRLGRECAGGNGKPLLPESEIVTHLSSSSRRRWLIKTSGCVSSWEIDKKLQEDEVLPIVYHTRPATCTQRQLKGLTVMVDSQYNGWRMEDVWLER
jgi:hypothetical protein